MREIHCTMPGSSHRGQGAAFPVGRFSWRRLAILLAILGWGFIAPALAQEAAPPDPSLFPPGAHLLTDPADIEAALREMTIYGRYTNDAEDWIEYHLRDGRTAYWEKGCTYPGRWWMEKGFVCYAYPNYRDNAPNCFLLFRMADGSLGFYQSDGGALFLSSQSLKIAPGNAAHLPVGQLSACVGV